MIEDEASAQNKQQRGGDKEVPQCPHLRVALAEQQRRARDAQREHALLPALELDAHGGDVVPRDLHLAQRNRGTGGRKRVRHGTGLLKVGFFPAIPFQRGTGGKKSEAWDWGTERAA